MGISATPYPSRPKASDIIDSGTLSVTNIAFDHGGEKTAAHGNVFDTVLKPAAGLINAAGQVIKSDHFDETTGSHSEVFDHPIAGTLAAPGNSATGSVLVMTFGSIAPTLGAVILAIRIRRAGVYKHKVYNSVAFVGGGHVHIYKNGASQAETSANNAADTDQDIGDVTYAAGDLFYVMTSIAVPANQFLMVSFYNADGMWG
jgi:hypothetical protein